MSQADHDPIKRKWGSDIVLHRCWRSQGNKRWECRREGKNEQIGERGKKRSVDNTGFEPVTFHKAHLQMEMRSENHTPRPITQQVSTEAD